MLRSHFSAMANLSNDEQGTVIDVIEGLILIFDQGERIPSDDSLLQLEPVGQLPPDEQAFVREVLDSLIIKYQARRWDSARATSATKAPQRKQASR